MIAPVGIDTENFSTPIILNFTWQLGMPEESRSLSYIPKPPKDFFLPQALKHFFSAFSRNISTFFSFHLPSNALQKFELAHFFESSFWGFIDAFLSTKVSIEFIFVYRFSITSLWGIRWKGFFSCCSFYGTCQQSYQFRPLWIRGKNFSEIL